MSAHFHFLDLRRREKLGERVSEREQINCIISAYKINPRHKCSSSSSAFCIKEGWQWMKKESKWQKQRGRSRKRKLKRDGGSVLTQRWVRNKCWWFVRKGWWRARAQGREVDRCPVRVQWSGVFNLTWWTSYWKHHPSSSSFPTPTPFFTDRKPCDGAVFKVI